MKRKALTIISILVIAILTACGPAPAPTLSPGDMASTAIADAWTQVGMTQAALPTATPPPPTPTSLPTFTPFPTLALPTLAPATLPVATEVDPCDQPPPLKPLGTTVQVKFVNNSGGSVNLSFGMVEKNAQDECGTYGFTLARYDEPVVTILAGCYWGYGWVTGDKPSTTQTINYLCLTDTTKTTAVSIGPEVIVFP